ncbi:hypothetical protein BLNAU_9212 [Blattamonas nauphoetae]|uniref:C2 domain-containing protein n=1 Tax=Blattamonas nauphoetae TaxID=2049346 RepID=A0ABQ9XWL0_9EUKA|nr:hypothetical protein BLNAU_9212 [Blattamonas nauphoetae]
MSHPLDVAYKEAHALVFSILEVDAPKLPKEYDTLFARMHSSYAALSQLEQDYSSQEEDPSKVMTFMTMAILGDLNEWLQRLHDVAERRATQGYSITRSEIDFFTELTDIYNFFKEDLLPCLDVQPDSLSYVNDKVGNPRNTDVPILPGSQRKDLSGRIRLSLLAAADEDANTGQFDAHNHRERATITQEMNMIYPSQSELDVVRHLFFRPQEEFFRVGLAVRHRKINTPLVILILTNMRLLYLKSEDELIGYVELGSVSDAVLKRRNLFEVKLFSKWGETIEKEDAKQKTSKFFISFDSNHWVKDINTAAQFFSSLVRGNTRPPSESSSRSKHQPSDKDASFTSIHQPSESSETFLSSIRSPLPQFGSSVQHFTYSSPTTTSRPQTPTSTSYSQTNQTSTTPGMQSPQIPSTPNISPSISPSLSSSTPISSLSVFVGRADNLPFIHNTQTPPSTYFYISLGSPLHYQHLPTIPSPRSVMIPSNCNPAYNTSFSFDYFPESEPFIEIRIFTEMGPTKNARGVGVVRVSCLELFLSSMHMLDGWFDILQGAQEVTEKKEENEPKKKAVKGKETSTQNNADTNKPSAPTPTLLFENPLSKDSSKPPPTSSFASQLSRPVSSTSPIRFQSTFSSISSSHSTHSNDSGGSITTQPIPRLYVRMSMTGLNSCRVPDPVSHPVPGLCSIKHFQVRQGVPVVFGGTGLEIVGVLSGDPNEEVGLIDASSRRTLFTLKKSSRLKKEYTLFDSARRPIGHCFHKLKTLRGKKVRMFLNTGEMILSIQGDFHNELTIQDFLRRSVASLTVGEGITRGAKETVIELTVNQPNMDSSLLLIFTVYVSITL